MSVGKRLGWSYIFWFAGVGNFILSFVGYVLLVLMSLLGWTLMALQAVAFVGWLVAHWMIGTPPIQVVRKRI